MPRSASFPRKQWFVPPHMYESAFNPAPGSSASVIALCRLPIFQVNPRLSCGINLTGIVDLVREVKCREPRVRARWWFFVDTRGLLPGRGEPGGYKGKLPPF